MKIGIINQNTQNYGDDIAGVTLIENLLEMDNVESIDIIYKMSGMLPINNEKVNHNQHLKMKHYGKIRLILYFLFRGLGYKGKKDSELRNTIEVIDKCDYIIVSPCGANIGIYKDSVFLLRILLALRERKKTIFCLNTIGSSGSFLFDKIAKFALKKSRVYVREKKSYEYLQKIGIKSELGVDTAFGFKNKEQIKRRENVIGFVPTFLNSWHPNFQNINIETKVFEEIIPQIIEFAKKNEYKIELIPHMNTQKEKEFYEKVKKEFDKRKFYNIAIRSDVVNTYLYNNTIASCRMIISMRYHGIVLAAKNGIPFASLSYENKMQEVCRYTEMLDYSIMLYDEKEDFNKLTDILNQVNENNEKISEHLSLKVKSELVNLSKLPLKELEEK